MQIARLFTSPDTGAYGAIRFISRRSEARAPDGRLTYHSDALELPQGWSASAADLLAQQILRHGDVPAVTKRLPEADVPAFLWRSVADDAALADLPPMTRYGSETSAKQVFDRMAGAWAYHGWKAGAFTDAAAAQNYLDDMRHMLAAQMASPALAQWRQTGLHWAYGLQTGCDAHPERVALHGPVIHSPAAPLELAQKDAALLQAGRASSTDLSGQDKLMRALALIDRACADAAPSRSRKHVDKLVLCDSRHAEVTEFLEWKLVEEQKVASLIAGSKLHEQKLNAVLAAIRDHQGPTEDAADPARNAALRQAIRSAKKAMIPEAYIARTLAYAAQGVSSISFPTYDSDWDSDAYRSVAGQATATALLLHPEDAPRLRAPLAHAAWATTPPMVVFADTLPASPYGPCQPSLGGSYIGPADTTPVEATINLAAFLQNGRLDLDGLAQAARLWLLTLDIGIDLCAYPSAAIAARNQALRPLGLGMSNLAALLMGMGLRYDSTEARHVAGFIAALLTGHATKASAERASDFATTACDAGQIHAQAQALLALPAAHCPDRNLSAAAKAVWAEAQSLSAAHGLRNGLISHIHADPDACLLMDCESQALDPMQALVRFTRIEEEGFTKTLTPAVPAALQALGYGPAQISAIAAYALGHRSLAQAPIINHASLNALGFGPREIARLEAALPSAFDIRYLFNQWTLGLGFCKEVLGIAAQDLADPCFDLLAYLGYGKAEIDAVNAHVCGTMTLEGAPYLHPAHLAIFDCLQPCGASSTRRVGAEAQLRMLGAVQPCLSGGIAAQLTLSHGAQIEDMAALHQLAHDLGLRAVQIGREGSALSHPMVLDLLGEDDEAAEAALTHGSAAQKAAVLADGIVEKVIIKEVLRSAHLKLPERRKGYTQKALVGGQKVYLRTGEYADGRLGEIFIDLHKEASGFRAMMNNFAIAISIGLQHGVPLEEFVDTFAFSKFEPMGDVKGSDAIKSASSLLDYVFRELAASYLDRKDLVEPQERKPQSATSNAPAQNRPRKGAAQELVVLQGGIQSSTKVSGTVAMGEHFGTDALSMGNAALSYDPRQHDRDFDPDWDGFDEDQN